MNIKFHQYKYSNELNNINLVVRCGIFITILLPVMLILHELGHYFSALIFCHVQSNIRFFVGQSAGLCVYSGKVTQIVGYSGGIFVAIIALLMYLIFKRKLSIDSKIYILAIFTGQLLYGIYEGIFL